MPVKKNAKLTKLVNTLKSNDQFIQKIFTYIKSNRKKKEFYDKRTCPKCKSKMHICTITKYTDYSRTVSKATSEIIKECSSKECDEVITLLL